MYHDCTIHLCFSVVVVADTPVLVCHAVKPLVYIVRVLLLFSVEVVGVIAGGVLLKRNRSECFGSKGLRVLLLRYRHRRVFCSHSKKVPYL